MQLTLSIEPHILKETFGGCPVDKEVANNGQHGNSDDYAWILKRHHGDGRIMMAKWFSQLLSQGSHCLPADSSPSLHCIICRPQNNVHHLTSSPRLSPRHHSMSWLLSWLLALGF